MAAVCRRGVTALESVGTFTDRPGPNGSREECLEVLVEQLNRYQWRSLTLLSLSRLLVGAAEAGQHGRAWFDIHVGLLLDSAG